MIVANYNQRLVAAAFRARMTCMCPRPIADDTVPQRDALNTVEMEHSCRISYVKAYAFIIYVCIYVSVCTEHSANGSVMSDRVYIFYVFA